MKHIILTILLIVIMNSYCEKVSGDKIVVEGQVMYKFDSDKATITLSLISYDSSLSKANQKNNEKLKKLKMDLEIAGIPAKDVSLNENKIKKTTTKCSCPPEKIFFLHIS